MIAQLIAQLIAQAKKLGLSIGLIYALPLLLLLAVAAASVAMKIPVAKFTRDWASVAHVHPFTSMVSNLGVVVWFVGATVCLFSWAILRAASDGSGRPTFLLAAGLFTAYLGLDDLFLLHDIIFPDYFGIKEKYTYLAYFVLIVAGLFVFRQTILKTDYLLLLIALGFFGFSIFVDIVQYRIQPYVGPWRILYEDGAKLLGIAGWLGYFLQTGLSCIAGHFRNSA